MTVEQGIARQLDEYRADFEKGDYLAFFQALLLCGTDYPLPEWVHTVVVQQAEDAFNKGRTGRGRTRNWRAQLNRMQIDRRRANMVEMHLNGRRRFGRRYVSWMAAMDGYGTPSDKHPKENAVTLDDILEAVSKALKGTPFQGTAEEMRASYKAVKGPGRRKRKR